MVVAEDQAARSADSAALSRDPRSATESIASTRRAGGREKEQKPRKVWSLSMPSKQLGIVKLSRQGKIFQVLSSFLAFVS